MKPALNNKPLVILSAITLILAAAVVGLLIFMKNQPAPKRGIQPLIQLAALEPNPALWGENFPNEYSTLLLSQDAPGTKAPSKLAADPRLVELFLGTGFSKDYNEPRGHMNSLTDVRTTLRVNDKTPGTCYSCKSSNNPGLWTQMGMEAFDKTPFSALTPQIQNPIGCANCHEANTMRLVITNPAVETALKSEGINWQTATRQQMRSLVCANCHVNYYFAGDAKLLTVPWQNGTTIEALEKSYDQVNFSDFTHPESGAGLVKMRHPDYELYTAGSTHYTAGVSCADCHMPYLRDGAAKFSSHTMKSPLDNPAESCGACHTNVDHVVARAKAIQQQVVDTQGITEDALIAAIKAIQAAAAKPGADPALIADARTLHRHAQERWDYIASSNGKGFHNPEEALRILASATDLARQAQLKAVQAAPGA